MEHEPTTSQDLIYPLCQFDGAKTDLVEINADAVPQPYHGLLVHDSDMTSTLEAYFEEPMRLCVLDKRIEDGHLFRQVLLEGLYSGRVAEFGAIHIDLTVFDEPVRNPIEACLIPLGAVLRDHGIAYHSSPSAYLKLKAGPAIRQMLGSERESDLFGRKNTLTLHDGRTFARIIELLPQIDEGHTQ